MIEMFTFDLQNEPLPNTLNLAITTKYGTKVYRPSLDYTLKGKTITLTATGRAHLI